MADGYAGDLSPQEAYELVRDDAGAALVDVRTTAEWAYVGQPDLSGVGKQTAGVEWVRFGGAPNPDFVTELEALGLPKGAPVVFLCRSGVRSVAAAQAATAAGYERAYNVLEGFEGNADPSGHRGTVAGWKVAGLPWRQP